jgi:hypothetical protein
VTRTAVMPVIVVPTLVVKRDHGCSFSIAARRSLRLCQQRRMVRGKKRHLHGERIQRVRRLQFSIGGMPEQVLLRLRIRALLTAPGEENSDRNDGEHGGSDADFTDVFLEQREMSPEQVSDGGEDRRP